MTTKRIDHKEQVISSQNVVMPYSTYSDSFHVLPRQVNNDYDTGTTELKHFIRSVFFPAIQKPTASRTLELELLRRLQRALEYNNIGVTKANNKIDFQLPRYELDYNPQERGASKTFSLTQPNPHYFPDDSFKPNAPVSLFRREVFNYTTQPITVVNTDNSRFVCPSMPFGRVYVDNVRAMDNGVIVHRERIFNAQVNDDKLTANNFLRSAHTQGLLPNLSDKLVTLNLVRHVSNNPAELYKLVVSTYRDFQLEAPDYNTAMTTLVDRWSCNDGLDYLVFDFVYMYVINVFDQCLPVGVDEIYSLKSGLLFSSKTDPSQAPMNPFYFDPNRKDQVDLSAFMTHKTPSIEFRLETYEYILPNDSYYPKMPYYRNAMREAVLIPQVFDEDAEVVFLRRKIYSSKDGKLTCRMTDFPEKELVNNPMFFSNREDAFRNEPELLFKKRMELLVSARHEAVSSLTTTVKKGIHDMVEEYRTEIKDKQYKLKMEIRSKDEKIDVLKKSIEHHEQTIKSFEASKVAALLKQRMEYEFQIDTLKAALEESKKDKEAIEKLNKNQAEHQKQKTELEREREKLKLTQLELEKRSIKEESDRKQKESGGIMAFLEKGAKVLTNVVGALGATVALVAGWLSFRGKSS